jgi:TonB-linked SusC/RagA family outer membrane protein
MKKMVSQHFGSKIPLMLKGTLLVFFSILIMLPLRSEAFSTTAVVQGKKITINLSNVPLKHVLSALQKESSYRFLYNTRLIDEKQLISISAANEDVTSILDKLFGSTSISYKIVDKQIILSPKESSTEKKTDVKESSPNRGGEKVKRDVKGKVCDEAGQPIPGATIVLDGTAIRTATNADGTFVLSIPEGKKDLLISFVGYTPQTLRLTGNEAYKIYLKQESKKLDEVVVTGYQTIKKERLTGSVTAVGAKELDRKSVTNVMNNLEGKVAGLVVSYDKNTGKSKATIRGIGTLNSSNDILLVIDGLPTEGSIEDINPYDVENISVLKDAAATAIYGARASNGVIVVVTKRAKSKEKISIEASANISYYNKPNYNDYHYMTPSQQVDTESKYYDWYFNGGEYGTVNEMVKDFESGVESGYPATPIQYAYYQLAKGTITTDQLNAKLTELKKNDFYKQYNEHALLNQVIQQYNIALRMNNDRSQSNLVVNYKTDNSGLVNAYNKQLNIYYKGSFMPYKWLDINYGINSIIGQARSQSNYNATRPFNVPSYYSLFDENGNRAYYSLGNFNIYSSYNKVFETTQNLNSLKFNHLDELERDFSNSTTRNTRYFVNLNFKVIPGLTINPQFQYEDNTSDNSTYSEAQSYTMRWLQNVYTTQSGSGTTLDPYTYTNLLPAGGRLGTSNTKSPSYTARAQVNYDKEFGKHAISVIAGTEFRQTRSYGAKGVLFGYDEQLQTQSTSAIDYNTLSKYSSVFWNSGVWPFFMEYPMYIDGFGLNTDIRHRYASGYANFTYTYDKKFNIFGSARKDYADLFGGAPKFRGRPLWSIGAAWNISNENFMKDVKFINYLKLRASYGETGNISTNYTSRLTASISGNQYYTNLPTATVVTPPNSKLRWERTTTTNIGTDFGMFDNRLRGTFDWYYKKGTDLFSQKRLDVTQGYSTLIINNGDMINKGVELSLNYDWVRSSDANGFNWSSTLILSHNKNEITKVDDIATTPSALAGSGAFKKGYPVNSLFSYQYKGLNANGLPQYLLSDGTLTTGTVPASDINAVVYSGSTDPKTNISLSNELSYGGFSLSVFALYYGGHYTRDNAVSVYGSPSYGAMPNYLLNSWTPTNTNTDIPGFGQYYQSQVDGSQLRNADKWVKHADFIKIRNIVLGYDIPKSVVQKIKISGVKLRFQVDNLKTVWTRDNLIDDPETGGLPMPTSYVFGVNVNF